MRLSLVTRRSAGRACLCQEELQELAKALTVPVDSLPPRNSAYLALDDLTECKRRCLRSQRMSGRMCRAPAMYPRKTCAGALVYATTRHTSSKQPALLYQASLGDRMTQRSPDSRTAVEARYAAMDAL